MTLKLMLNSKNIYFVSAIMFIKKTKNSNLMLSFYLFIVTFAKTN